MDIRRVLWALAETAFEALTDFNARCGLILYFSKPDAPAAPDYAGAAQAQGGADVQTAIVNALLGRPSQITPYGTQTWSQTGTSTVPGAGGQPSIEIPQLTSNINLTPEGQQLFDADTQARLGLSNLGQQILPQVQDALASPLDLSSLPEDYNQTVADALYSRSARYLDPQWSQAESDTRTRLANSGFSQQNEGYGKEISNFQDSKDRAYGAARDTATAEGERIGTAQRQQAIQEILLQRQNPLSELNAVRTGAQPNLPQFAQYPSGTAQPAPIAGATAASGQYAGDLYNSQVGTYNSQMGGLYGLGGAGLMALALSDRRLKQAVRKIGQHPRGFGIYEFQYLWSEAPHVGVMADEVLPVIPEAVSRSSDGFFMVDYGRL